MSKKGLTWQIAYIGGGFLGVFFLLWFLFSRSRAVIKMYPECRIFRKSISLLSQCPASSESHRSPLLRRSLVDLVPQWPSIPCGKISTMTDFLKEGPREQAPRGGWGHAPWSSLSWVSDPLRGHKMPGNWKKKTFVRAIFQISTWKVILLLLKICLLWKIWPIPVVVGTSVDQRLRVLLSLFLFLFFSRLFLLSVS